MNEIVDKLFVQFFLCCVICLGLYGYKYIHILFRKKLYKQISRVIQPAEQELDVLHLYSRIIGLAIILTSLDFQEYHGVAVNLVHYFLWAVMASILYLASLFVIEAVNLPNFNYVDECLKRKNVSYTLTVATVNITTAFVLRSVFFQSDRSLILLLIYWLVALVLWGLMARVHFFFSPYQLQRGLIQQNLATSVSFSGHLCAAAIVVCSVLEVGQDILVQDLIEKCLRTILALLTYPLFLRGVQWVFPRRKRNESVSEPELGEGIYDAGHFCVSALLTSVLISNIRFGTIYPFF